MPTDTKSNAPLVPKDNTRKEPQSTLVRKRTTTMFVASTPKGSMDTKKIF